MEVNPAQQSRSRQACGTVLLAVLGLALAAAPVCAQGQNPSSASNPFYGSVTLHPATDDTLKLSLDGAIALGLKPYETRDWATSYRGPLAIHAAKRLWHDTGPWHDSARAAMRRRMERAFSFGMAYGAVVCVVDLADCIRTSELRGRIPADEEFWGDFSDGELGRGRYAFRLRNLRVLPEPLPIRGAQGFFDVDIPGAFRRGEVGSNYTLFG